MLTEKDREAMEGWRNVILQKLRQWAECRSPGNAASGRRKVESMLRRAGFDGTTLLGLLRFFRRRKCPSCEGVVGPPPRGEKAKLNLSSLLEKKTCSRECAAVQIKRHQRADGYDADGEPTEKELEKIEQRKASLLKLKRLEPSSGEASPYERQVYSLPAYRKSNALH